MIRDYNGYVYIESSKLIDMATALLVKYDEYSAKRKEDCIAECIAENKNNTFFGFSRPKHITATEAEEILRDDAFFFPWEDMYASSKAMAKEMISAASQSDEVFVNTRFVGICASWGIK